MRINGHGISDGAYSAVDLLMARSNTKINLIGAMVTASCIHVLINLTCTFWTLLTPGVGIFENCLAG